MQHSTRRAAVTVLLLAFTVLGCASVGLAEILSPFDVFVKFDAATSFTLSQKDLFAKAEEEWESVIKGYQAEVSFPFVQIKAKAITLDGVGGRLGSGQFTTFSYEGGLFYATGGLIELDVDDLAGLENNHTLYSVILHEMGHVFGFGTLWNANRVYTEGSGRYTGAAGLATYKSEFNQPNATYVPVELDGGEGTVNVHWNEANNGASLTGITDGQGHDMRNELMTGWLNVPAFMSQTTIQSFADMGFIVVPEPGALAMLLGMALMSLAWRMHKKKGRRQFRNP